MLLPAYKQCESLGWNDGGMMIHGAALRPKTEFHRNPENRGQNKQVDNTILT